MKRLLPLLILLPSLLIVYSLDTSPALGGKKRKVIESLIPKKLEKQPEKISTDILSNPKTKEYIKGLLPNKHFDQIHDRIDRETIHQHLCKTSRRSNQQKINRSNVPVYEQPNLKGMVLGKYESKEIICVKQEIKGWGMTYFGWIEKNSYE